VTKWGLTDRGKSGLDAGLKASSSQNFTAIEFFSLRFVLLRRNLVPGCGFLKKAVGLGYASAQLP
jgi:hypothetical protein